MSKFYGVTEIIPDDIPQWAKDAIDNGNFFKVCIDKVLILEIELSNIKNQNKGNSDS